MAKEVLPPTAETIGGEFSDVESCNTESNYKYNFNSVGINTPVESESVLEIARRLIEANISVIPIKPDGTKSPDLYKWLPFQEKRATENQLEIWFENGNGLAIVGGKISGNLEILDFDAPELFPLWCEMVEESVPNLLSRLPLVQTPSGGFHLYYRCDTVEGNLKLAEKLLNDEDLRKKDTLIETRGEGGYAVVPPSPAACHEENKPYVLLHGDLTEIPFITKEEREVLFSLARSFDEAVEQEKPKSEKTKNDFSGDRAGDEFNRQFDSEQWNNLLTKHGWTKKFVRRGVEYWQRDGKEGKGISATVNYKGVNVLKVFSTNAHPFETSRAYSPFAAYTFLEHGKDFKKAAKNLANDGYGKKSGNVDTTEQDLSLGFGTNQTMDNPQIKNVSSSPLIKLNLSDAGNAETMALIYKDRIRYDHTRRKWLIWDEVRWRVAR